MKLFYPISLAIITAIGISVYYKREHPQNDTLYRSGDFVVPRSVKRLALVGSTPHPTKFLEDGGQPERLAQITLADIIDSKDLADSFEKTLKICEEHQIDQLIVAYLPIYFAQVKGILGPETDRLITQFLHNMGQQVAHLIEQVRQRTHAKTTVTLFLPTAREIAQIPSPEIAKKLYTLYAVRELPHLYWNSSLLERLFIINTEGSVDQNSDIMRYLRYKQLSERYIPFEALTIPKVRFHTYR